MRAAAWNRWTLLCGLLACCAASGAGCNELELARLRCSVNGGCPGGYACGADGYCTRDADADAGATRAPGSAGGKALGEPCHGAAECGTGSCTDGVCCNEDCAEACRACNLPDNVGTCMPVARAAAPRHGDCPRQSAASCGTNGLCDGAGQCQLHDATVVCSKAACDKHSDTLTSELHCDGRGHCAAIAAPVSCAPFRCRSDGSACADTCGGDSDCQDSDPCRNGSCGKIANGLGCRNADQCQSGFCVDGVCCNAPCSEQCMACDVAGAVGTCTPVPAGNPRGVRPPCAGPGTLCAGQCTPASGAACTYPAAATVCRSASCTNGVGAAVQTSAATCDGAGSCGVGSASSCGVYMCGAAGACATSCAGDFDCATGFICEAGVCQPRRSTAAPCSSSSQCASGLTCVDGVCCESACDQPCRACNLPGQAGHCAVVASADDADSCPAAARTCDASGACKLRNQQPCSAAADCAGGPCITFYPDADGDGYGDRSATLANGIAKGFCGAPPPGWVSNGADCCDAGDTMKQVHPGQTAWFTTPGPCGVQFDYDCDGAMTRQYPAGGTCDAAACTAGFTADTACGASGDFQYCSGASCGALVSQVQTCR